MWIIGCYSTSALFFYSILKTMIWIIETLTLIPLNTLHIVFAESLVTTCGV